MDIDQIEKARKRLFAYICLALALPVILGFTIVDLIEGDVDETLINLIMAAVFVAMALVIRRWNADRWAYRLGLPLLSATFLYNVVIGSGEGTAIYWLFAFPLVYQLFLGRKEGGQFATLFLVLLCLLLLNPLSLPIYGYPIGVSLRFLVSLLLVSLMAYGLELSREKYFHLVFAEHNQLLVEKQHLERAMKEIKTLSGLIPICTNCKQIRDDKGFWQQVED